MKDRLIHALLVVLLLSLPLSLFAAGGTVTGKITDAATNDVLPGANVTIEGTRMGAATGTNGMYSISNVPAGTHTLVVSFMGYKSQKMEVTVQDGAKSVTDFVLEKAKHLSSAKHMEVRIQQVYNCLLFLKRKGNHG
jgi:hypothetical protein